MQEVNLWTGERRILLELKRQDGILSVFGVLCILGILGLCVLCVLGILYVLRFMAFLALSAFWRSRHSWHSRDSWHSQHTRPPWHNQYPWHHDMKRGTYWTKPSGCNWWRTFHLHLPWGLPGLLVTTRLYKGGADWRSDWRSDWEF